MRWLAGGVLLAGLAQMLVLYPALKARGLWGQSVRLLRPSPEAREAAIGVLRRSLPLALGAAVYQVNVMVDGMMAQGLLPSGGQTVHYLANRVQQFPLALVAIAATTAVFPALAALGQQRRIGELRDLHDKTQRNVLFIALPATFGLAALAHPVTAVLFEHGNFAALGIDRTASALRVLAFAILPAGAVGLVARTYYSMGDYRTPVRVSCAMLFVNVGLNFAFLRGLGMDADGLALGTTISSFGNLVLLIPGLAGRLGLPKALPGFSTSFIKMIAAAFLCGLSAAAVMDFGADWFTPAIGLVIAMGTGAGVYAVATLLLRVPEWAQFAPRIHRAKTKFLRK
jgi:putative peptidoglycan lipid II flippase